LVVIQTFSRGSPLVRRAAPTAAGADPELVASLLVGAVYAQYLAGAPFAPGWSGRVVDLVLGGAGV
jgi:hypothetical protein